MSQMVKEMNTISISRPEQKDTHRLNEFFQTVIFHTFTKNGLLHMSDLMHEEIENKQNFLMQDFSSGGADRFFLVAKDGDSIVGTIEYGAPNDVIRNFAKGMPKNTVEIGTVFVHPDYQGKGLGSTLVTQMITVLRAHGVEKFCLDSGYPSAQKIWTVKFGYPSYLLKNYWGQGADHMIWTLTEG